MDSDSRSGGSKAGPHAARMMDYIGLKSLTLTMV
jgi:hypothetical protein